MSKDCLLKSVARAASYFGVKHIPKVYHSSGSYGECCCSPFGHRIGADYDLVDALERTNKQEKHPYDSITAHELEHSRIKSSGKHVFWNPRSEELSCDLMSGVYCAGTGASPVVFREIISKAESDEVHPDASTRLTAFKRGFEIGKKDPLCGLISYGKNPRLQQKVSKLKMSLFGVS